MITNPKHVADVKIAVEMIGQYQWYQIYIFQYIEIDHEARNIGIWCIVSWISDTFYRRILGIFAIPCVSA